MFLWGSKKAETKTSTARIEDNNTTYNMTEENMYVVDSESEHEAYKTMPHSYKEAAEKI